jgi:hypothetical protein
VVETVATLCLQLLPLLAVAVAVDQEIMTEVMGVLVAVPEEVVEVLLLERVPRVKEIMVEWEISREAIISGEVVVERVPWAERQPQQMVELVELDCHHQLQMCP